MTTLTPEEQIQKSLTGLLKTVTGVKAAFERAPTSTTANLPAAMTTAGRGEKTGKSGPGWLEVSRIFHLRIYVAHVQAGETGNAETKVIPFINRVTLTIVKYPQINAAGQWATMEYVSDSGVAVLPTYAGETFLGTEHLARVVYRIPYSYASKE
jgi:hypothetical protein